MNEPIEINLELKKSQPENEWNLPAALCDEELIAEIQAIPNQMGFKIGDVADILGLKTYVLRFWETEFDILKPKKASNNQRLYTKKDVENALIIRKLLYRDRFSIEGARNAMKDLRMRVKKEKQFSQIFERMGNTHEQVENILEDVRALRKEFAP